MVRIPVMNSANRAALAACILGLLGFALLVAGRGHRLDEAVLMALRQPGDPKQPIGPAWLALTLRDVTALGGIPVLALLTAIALGFLLVARQGRAAALLLLALPGGLVLNTLLKRGFDRPRPDLVAHLVQVESSSFPSGHAMLSAIGYLTLGALLAGAAAPRRQRGYILGVAVALTLLIGASRVYLGVHWPSDVLAGWCLGTAWAGSCWLALRRRG
ncbi:phosphatase PAP2 family protein [Belnapia sp. T6]|uniref:Phosphatase PAP2 family protein n=2 Tax=Belnapia mucosa TaxID=2804532 RepID=A0ABS1V049_9PROT|nr:phosphatase PAP2 family protein [Belnapia mucosa]